MSARGERSRRVSAELVVVAVLVTAVVGVVARSLRAALQCMVWGFVFSAVTMFPVYILEATSRFRTGGLYLDGDAPAGSTLASNLSDAVAWLLLVVPAVLVPIGIVLAAVLATIARTVAPPDRVPRVR